MAFNFNLGEFDKLANAALNAQNCNFNKSKVADRLTTCFPGRVVRVGRSASLELRRNLADVINDMYRQDGHVRIPASVASALKVDGTASGFKLQADGTLIATNHPLTDRRLVAIMTAIRLDHEGLGDLCGQLDAQLAELAKGSKGGSKGVIEQHVAGMLSSLTRDIRTAANRDVRPETLKVFMPHLTAKLADAKEKFETFRVIFDQANPADVEPIRAAIDLAIRIGAIFGAQIERLPPPAPMPIPVLVRPDLQQLDAEIKVAEDVPEEPEVEEKADAGADVPVAREQPVVEAPKGPTPEELQAQHEAVVLVEISNRVGEAAAKLGVNVQTLVAFSEADAEVFRKTDAEAAARIAEKVDAIEKGVRTIVDADLDEGRKVALLKRIVPADGAIAPGELDAEVKAYRREVNGKFAAEWKTEIAKDVAGRVLAAVLDDPACAVGLANLKRDFPMVKNFAKRVKANHAGGELPCFDLAGTDVLADMLKGKLEALLGAIDGVDTEQECGAFWNALDTLVGKSAETLATRLRTVLSASLFEDDRTVLVQMILDPVQADGFDAALAKARKLYDDSILERATQSIIANKVAAAKERPRSQDAVPKVSTAFATLHGFGAVDAPEKIQVKAVDDSEIGIARKNLGEQLRSDVRNLYADLFTAKAKSADGLREIIAANAATIQAMLLDPALVDATAIPGEGKDGDALRALFRRFLAKVGDNTNMGQLAPADFTASLKTELGGAAFAEFAEGLKEAGRQVLADMQKRLTVELTDVLRKLTSSGKNLKITEMTLAELGASGLGTFDEGYGKFLANALDNYFTDKSLVEDHDRMLESLFRNGKDGGTVGDAIGALVKGAGPIFQKVLQSIPVEGLPEEIVKALIDVKSGLAPIPEATIRARLDKAIAENNADPKRARIEKIEIVKSLGAASVGQAVLCTIHHAGGRKEQAVIKFLRPGVKAIAERERQFFRDMAAKVGPSMVKTFDARMDGILEEFDFTKEAGWVEKGQCYGNAENYGKAAQLKDDHPELDFASMGVSDALKPASDLLALKVAKGEPLDRRNQANRERLDKIMAKVTRRVADGKGGTLTVCETKTGFEFVHVRRELVNMYENVQNQRAMLEELLRRFSAELFSRNFSGKETGGGFMHGDLHGGNLLVDDQVMTVIDFGNSFAFTRAEREQLVQFVAACGFGMGEVALMAIDPNYKKWPNYGAILADVGAILAKGDANDIVSRGMAVVQYLQRKDIKVPGPVVNFTETVMRLSAAYEETNALMDDIADAIVELKVSPKADKRMDPYAYFGDNLLASNFDSKRLSNRNYAPVDMFQLSLNLIHDMAEGTQPLSDGSFDFAAKQMLLLLKDSTDVFLMPDGSSREVGESIRLITKEFELLGAGAFDSDDGTRKADPRAKELMKLLYRIAKTVQSHAFLEIPDGNVWSPDQGEGLNECMAVGLTKINKFTLAGIVGAGAAYTMSTSVESVQEKADRAVELRQVASDAQARYQHRVGKVDVKVRRFVDRLAKDHFIWSAGNPEKLFGKKWYADKTSVASVVSVLKLNLGKLRGGFAAAGLKLTPEIENYALLPFAMRYGLVKALGALGDKEWTAFVNSVGDADVAAVLRFLRTDPAVVEAVQLGRCSAHVQETITYASMQYAYHYAKANFQSLPGIYDFKNRKSLDALVKMISAQYATFKKILEDSSQDSKAAKLRLQYAEMRYLMDGGFLQALHALPTKGASPTRDEVLGKFDKPVRNFLKELLAYM